MDFRGLASYFIIIFNLVVLFYFAFLNTIYIVLFGAAFVQAVRHNRRRRHVNLYEVFRSPLTPSISVLVPAFNEEETIVDSVRSVLLLHYPRFEVVVINDGSTDETLEALVEQYGLRRISKAVSELVPSQQINGVYISPEYDNLVVVDKKNGGKSDALNAGINVCRNDLVCVIDADSIIEPEGLLKVARPFIEDPTLTLAVGGLVRIVNGCDVESGTVKEVRLPHNYLANMQIVEYLRAFLGGRIGWSALRSLLIISGAFGLFNRRLVISIGGYRTDTVGEDMDLVVRMHRGLRKNKRKYRMYFVPDPVCWTEAPERLSQLARQRDRWQRGLIDCMTSNLRMLFNPRYGVIGLFAMPYFFFFEMIGPFVEILGYVAVVLAFSLGMVNMQFFLLFLSLAFLYAVAVSLFSVMLEGVALRHYPRINALLRLAFYSVFENFGYRQLNSWWRTKAFFTYFTRKREWGAMERKGYDGAVEKPGRLSRRWRFALTLIVPVLIIAFVLTYILTVSGDSGISPEPVTVDGVGMVARTNGKYLEVHFPGGWETFTVKGANVGTAVPGKWFSEFPEDPDLYREWFEKIASMNANTIRVYTLLDPVFYRTLDDFNHDSDRKLMLLQEIWPDDEVPENNLFDEEYTRMYHREIETDIMALLGRANIPERKGRAWGEYDVDMSTYLLGVIVGREILYEESIATNTMNPGRNGYEGKYIRTTCPSSPVESWLAETCDYTVEQLNKQGLQAPVSFVSWPTLDPMIHPTEATPGLPKDQEHEDVEVVDPNHLAATGDAEAGLFACYHIYPYYPDFMYREPAYAEYSDGDGVLRYGGYLKQFMEQHPDYPALMGEFGMSTSMGIAHLHPDGFNHGGVTEKEQGEQISRMYRAILDEGFAGGVIFEWADEWAKRTWVDMAYMIPFDRHIFWHNVMDPEQNFGIMAYESDRELFSGSDTSLRLTGYEVAGGDVGEFAITGMSVDHDEAFVYILFEFTGKGAVRMIPGGEGGLELYVGIDTFGDDNGSKALPVTGLPSMPTGVEFMLKIDDESGGELLARPDYNRGTNQFMANPSNDPLFVPIKLPVNREQVDSVTGEIYPARYTNDSTLTYGEFDTGSDKFCSQGNWFVDEEGVNLYVRIPWLLLNVSDPSSCTVIHDERTDLPEGPSALLQLYPVDGLQTEKTKGFHFYAATTFEGELIDFQPRGTDGSWTELPGYSWSGWDQPRYRSRLKQSYPEITELFGGSP